MPSAVIKHKQKYTYRQTDAPQTHAAAAAAASAAAEAAAPSFFLAAPGSVVAAANTAAAPHLADQVVSEANNGPFALWP